MPPAINQKLFARPTKATERIRRHVFQDGPYGIPPIPNPDFPVERDERPCIAPVALLPANEQARPGFSKGGQGMRDIVADQI